MKKEKDLGSVIGGPKSLNVGYRKRETERIEKENHAFAKRLFDKHAQINKKKFDEDYAAHLKYRKQIQKLGNANKKGKKKELKKLEESEIKQRSKSVDKVNEENNEEEPKEEKK